VNEPDYAQRIAGSRGKVINPSGWGGINSIGIPRNTDSLFA